MNGPERPGLPGRHVDLRIPKGVSYIFRGKAVLWRCPFCGFGWPRYEDGGEMHKRAMAHLDAEDQKRWEVPVNQGR